MAGLRGRAVGNEIQMWGEGEERVMHVPIRVPVLLCSYTIMIVANINKSETA